MNKQSPNSKPIKKVTPIKSNIIKQQPNTSKKKKTNRDSDYFSDNTNINKDKTLQSADNRKYKRKSAIDSISNFNEAPINTSKLDETINSLWTKFVGYYNYEDTFQLENELTTLNSQSQNSVTGKEIDFDLKLQTIFNIYKIKMTQAPEYNLMSLSEEGSYLLKHAKTWIIYIKILKEKYELKFTELHALFNYALEYDVDEYLLFDFFIILSQEFEEDEVLEFDESKVPHKFIQIYNNNKDHILKTLKEEEEKDLTSLSKNNSDNEENGMNFSFSDKQKTFSNDLNQLKINSTTENDSKIVTNFNTGNENDDLEFNTINIPFAEDIDKEILSAMDYKNYLINTPAISVIEEESKESELTTPVLTTVKKTPVNKDNMILFNSFSKYSRKYESNYSIKKLNNNNIEINSDQAYIADPNVRNSGNFAILELSSKSQEKIGAKYVLTPLKKAPYSSNKEMDEAQKDLDQVRKEFSEFVYHPYDDELKAKIDNNSNSTDLNSRKLSFSKSEDYIIEEESKEKSNSNTIENIIKE